MKRVIRLALVVSAAVVSLAVTSSAWASYSPSLTVTASNNKPGAATSLLLGHIQTPTDDPTAKDTIYAPLGYGVNLTQAPGTKIGDVSATLILRNGGNAEVAVDGSVVADNPANHPNDQCAPGLHQAVWNLNINVAGTPLTVPLYVDAVTAGPEAAFASAKIQFCLAGPIGTPAGAQLEFAFFDVNGVFSNPRTRATGYGARPSRRTWPGRRSRTLRERPRGRPSFQDKSASRWRRRASSTAS
jgi:hypothetical protein